MGQIEPASRHLPANLPRDAERTGYRILSALDRLGFTHKNQDGTFFSIRFSDVALFGGIAAYSVDTERLWHFAIADLSKPRVTEHLSAVLHKPLIAHTREGLTYLVRMTPRPQAQRLPSTATLDFDQRPYDTLAVPLGMAQDGPQWRNLAALGHCLITGATGAGKSTWIHSALGALLTANTPDQLQLVLIDPKRSELTPWNRAPQLLGRIANTSSQAKAILADVVTEIDQRGDLLASESARDIVSYNKRADEALPYLLVVIDEALDLVLDGGRDLLRSLKTIAMRGRSAGVILWCATQHAAAITGLPRVVNVNLTTRLVFRVADRSAADTAGCPGAEAIPRDRPGRLLAKVDGGPQELQAYWLADNELQALARAVSRDVQSGPALTEQERTLVHYALDSLDGAFIIGKLAAAEVCDLSKYRIEQLGKLWERRGWLTKPQHATDARKVTPQLAALTGR